MLYVGMDVDVERDMQVYVHTNVIDRHCFDGQREFRGCLGFNLILPLSLFQGRLLLISGMKCVSQAALLE